MKERIVAMPFRHHATHVCEEARRMLTDAGFVLRCNDTGRVLSPEEQHEMIRDAYAVIAGTERYPREMLEGCDDLRVILRFGVGCDNFDLDAMRDKGIRVGVISNCNAVAEFTVMLMLGAIKSASRAERAVRRGEWARFPMRELRGRTIGLIGFGRIGRRVAELLSGFGVTLLVADPYADAATVGQYHAEAVDADTLLARADVVSLHLPLTDGTRHFLNTERIARMRDGAILVNTARGALVDEAALLSALQSGKLFAAGLDVYEHEPIRADDPLLRQENTVLSPHCAAITHETNYNGGLTCAESILRVADGGDPIYPVL